MAYCDSCGNFDASHDDRKASRHSEHYRPELYYYWDSPLEEDYDWRDNFPEADCLCEICFDIANEEGKIKWLPWALGMILLPIPETLKSAISEQTVRPSFYNSL